LSSLKEIFEKFIREVEPEIKKKVGSFSSSVESEIRVDGFTIYASPYIRVLIDGRKPTRDGASKGNPTLQQVILDWIERHSIQPNEIGMTQESLSWAISKSIHKKGTLLYQRGGGNRIFDDILTTQREDNLLSLISDIYYTQLTTIART
jgi:hypothetical protein